MVAWCVVLACVACDPGAPPDPGDAGSTDGGIAGGTGGGSAGTGGGSAGTGGGSAGTGGGSAGTGGGSAGTGGGSAGTGGGSAGTGGGSGGGSVDPDGGQPDGGDPDGGQPDTTPPLIVDQVPAAGATSVSTLASLVFKLDEPIDRQSVTLTTIPSMTFQAPTFSDGDTTVTIAPVGALMPNTPYTATFDVRDLAGNALVMGRTFTFTTAMPADTTPPTVLSTSPANNATNVPLANLTVQVTFNEPMSATNLNLTSTSHSIQFSQPVLTSNDTVATWSMNLNSNGMPLVLDPNTTYSLRLTGFDVSNNAMAPYTFSFTSQAQPDSTPPTVVRSQPDQGANMVPRNARVSIVFSEPMNTASVQSAMTVDGAAAAGTFTWAGGNSTLLFIPSTPFSVGAHTVSISNAATDISNNNMASAHSFSFTVINAFDTSAPGVASTTPANNAVAVLTESCAANPVRTTISVTFTEPMDRSSVEQSLRVSHGASQLAGQVTFNPNSTVATFTPTMTLPNGAVITVSITGALDLSGNTLPASTFSFTTIERRTTTLLAEASKTGYVANSVAVSPVVAVPAAPTVGELVEPVAAARGFIGFPSTTAVTTMSCIREARLTVEQLGVTGTPFGSSNLGSLFVDTVDIGTALDMSDFDAMPSPFLLPVLVSSSAAVSDSSNPRAGLRIVDVLPMARGVYGLANPANIRWRLRFTNLIQPNGQVQKVQLAAPNQNTNEPSPKLVIVHDTP
jgi:hypothetical protein